MLGRVKQAAYVGMVLAAAAVLFLAVLVGIEPGLIDIGLEITSTTWVLFAVGVGLLSMFVMLLGFRAMA